MKFGKFFLLVLCLSFFAAESHASIQSTTDTICIKLIKYNYDPNLCPKPESGADVGCKAAAEQYGQYCRGRVAESIALLRQLMSNVNAARGTPGTVDDEAAKAALEAAAAAKTDAVSHTGMSFQDLMNALDNEVKELMDSLASTALIPGL